jgi:hypothetical protein
VLQEFDTLLRSTGPLSDDDNDATLILHKFVHQHEEAVLPGTTYVELAQIVSAVLGCHAHVSGGLASV